VHLLASYPARAVANSLLARQVIPTHPRLPLGRLSLETVTGALPQSGSGERED
jgi:hypothetical protein